MNKLLLSVTSIIITIMSVNGSVSYAQDLFKFAAYSPLAEGQWIKIGVDKTGVYEISHEALLSMGFSEPEKVGVFGRGGKSFDFNFCAPDGSRIYTDGLEQISVFHLNGKMYFYGVGPRQFVLNRATHLPADGWFARSGNNIYSETGCYFLSDSRNPQEMIKVERNVDTDSEFLSYAYGMISHEADLRHNNTDSGQLFYGESIGIDNNKVVWPVKLPGAVADGDGVMECTFYYDTELGGSWSYGLTGTQDPKIYQFNKINTSTLRTISPAYQGITIPSENTEVFVEVNSLEGRPVLSNLDYWTLTYKRNIPTLKDTEGKSINQETIGLPHILAGGKARLRLPGGADFLVVDVTEPYSPRVLPVITDGSDGIVEVESTDKAPILTVFDPLRPQFQIKGYDTGYSRIINQNLHQQAAEGADLVIICIPELKDVAYEIGRLHADADGIKTLVATTEECYNEFSAGLPDPIAYRALVKATYSSQHPCKNLLLLGPLHSDYRGVVTSRTGQNGIIAYQCPIISQQRGAANANDVMGMMDDYINLTDIHINKMHVGVGILPVKTPDEAVYILDKIKRYLKADDIEMYLNAYTQIGGFGDRHTHDGQAIQLSNMIDILSDYASVITTLPVDAYGDQRAQSKLWSDLEEGRLFINYFGHGATNQLNQSGKFFQASDVYRMRNLRLPFMAFAGCSLSNCDRGKRGMGESMVISTPYGAIGSLLATRETWSGENAVLFDDFYTNMFRNGRSLSSPRHDKAPTIGELFARTKTDLSSNNELAYQLLCDPAIVIPVTTRSTHFYDISPDFTVGEKVTVSGYVSGASNNGEIDGNFNGKVVARLMEPVKTVISEDLITGPSEDVLRFPIADRQLTMAKGEVINGHFTIELFVPSEASEFIGQPSRLHLVVYSPETRTAGGGLITGTIKKKTGSHQVDTTPPMIEHISFDTDKKLLHVRVSDNIAPSLADNALDPAFKLVLDGRELSSARHTVSIPDINGKAYEKTINLADLTFGRHHVRVSVKDASGNRAYAESEFSYMPGGAEIKIALEKPAVGDSVRIFPVNGLPDDSELVVLDADGFEVCRFPFPADGMEWDGTDNYGSRLTPALYKAYVIQRGETLKKSHSDLIDLPVIRQ